MSTTKLGPPVRFEAKCSPGRTIVLSLGCLLGFSAAFFAAPEEASAVELYYDSQGRLVLPSPVRVVTRRGPRLTPRPQLRVVAPRRVHVRVQTPPPRTVVVSRSPTPHSVVDPGPARRNAYDTTGLVVAGAGAGGAVFFGDGVTGAAVAYRLHLGLAIGASEFAINADLIPDGIEVAGPSGNTPAALYTVGASFNYRFLDNAVVHPVAGIGLEAMITDPHEGEGGSAFAVTARAGLEFAYPLADGALALGIDVTGHHPFVQTDDHPGEAVDMLTFGAYLHYRF
ncbi:MAG: hypothetical protein AAGF12_15295 [Myxococcota bacterium]